MEKHWFEFVDLRDRKYEGAVWVPLAASNTIINEGKYGSLDYKNEFFGLSTVAVYPEKREEAELLTWQEICEDAGSSFEEENYVASDTHLCDDRTPMGVRLVLTQSFNRYENPEWHLHQDLVIALGLKREGDNWVCPHEGYLQVARLSRDAKGRPSLIEIKSNFLKDYLSARNLSLRICSFRNRRKCYVNAEQFDWAGGRFELEKDGYAVNSWINEIHEGGMPFGEKAAVFHLERTDIDPEEDVPTFGLPEEGKIKSKKMEVEYKGKKIFLVMSDFSKNEWFEKGTHSHRVKGDEITPTAFFFTDASGKRESKETLNNEGRWLWFKPEVITEIVQRRGASLEWYTKDTGRVGLTPDGGVHFGVNSIGLINVYAKDISYLPEWQQDFWVGYNVLPEGKVSTELQDSQVRASPSKTQAPEEFLPKAINRLNEVFLKKHGFAIFRDHQILGEILKNTHRFRSVNNSGLFSLSKDIARLTADSIDPFNLQKIAPPPKGEKWGSLKSLEKLLATKLPAEDARRIVGPLFGAYNLRHGDAHLPSSDLEGNFKILKIDRASSYVNQGCQLLHSIVDSLFIIAENFDK